MGATVSFARSRSSSTPDLQAGVKVEDVAPSKSDGKAENNTADSKDSKESKISSKEVAAPPLYNGVRRMSLQDMMTPANPFSPREEFIQDTDKITVGDIVRVTHEGKESEGMVIEKVNNMKLRIDFGERIHDCLLDECVVLVRNYEFEVGDKVEARPPGMNLFFVGKVVKMYPDKSMDILMDGDDLSDIEKGITPDNCRKLMSRRSVVINRWKRAFMMVVAANFFKRISFVGDRRGSRQMMGGQVKGLSAHMSITEEVDEDEKFSL